MSVTWRDATRDDLPEIERLWDEQERRFEDLGVKVDRPSLFYPEGETEHAFYPYRPPVLRVRVAESGGIVVGFKYQEAVPETTIVTRDQDVIKSVGAELIGDAHYFKSKGFRSGWGLIPARFIAVFERFTRNYPHLRAWRSLTPVGIDFMELGD